MDATETGERGQEVPERAAHYWLSHTDRRRLTPYARGHGHGQVEKGRKDMLAIPIINLPPALR
jgi:repressor of nif and glnA expression